MGALNALQTQRSVANIFRALLTKQGDMADNRIAGACLFEVPNCVQEVPPEAWATATVTATHSNKAYLAVLVVANSIPFC